MKIGKLPTQGGAINEGKWYIGVEMCMYRPDMHYEGFAFRPYFVFMFVKITKWGTEGLMMGGEKQERIGGWWRFEFPIGIHINIDII